MGPGQLDVACHFNRSASARSQSLLDGFDQSPPYAATAMRLVDLKESDPTNRGRAVKHECDVPGH